jgi:SpoVK/Ycf46/Vps4 family AAA+-type ATPase
MHEAKRAIKTIARTFQDPETSRRLGLRPPRGVLLWGPPGTGKTTLAHALAHEIGAVVWEVDSAGMWDRFIGDSSKNARAIFDALRQRRHKPVVLFFDEMDSLVGKTAPEAGGGATSERNMVNGLLRRELERVENAVVVGTTNDPDRMDPELLRSGRFDHKIAVSLPTEPERVEIMAVLMANHIRDTDNSELYEVGIAERVGDLVRKMDGWSGAEMAELLRRAAERRFAEWSGEEPVPSITMEDLRVEFDRFGR